MMNIRQNPKSWQVGAGVAALGVAAWVAYRLRERAQLRELMEESDLVKRAIEGGFITWEVDEKAAELVSFFNTTSAEDAYVDVLAEAQRSIPVEPSDLVSLTEDMRRAFEEKTGMTTSAAADSIYQSLPDVPFIDTQSWYDYFTKSEVSAVAPAKTNGRYR